MKKRMTFIFAFAMAMTLLPTIAFAGEMPEEGQDSILKIEGKIVYDNEVDPWGMWEYNDGILTLKNAQIEPTDESIPIYAKGNLTIVLEGSNFIDETHYNQETASGYPSTGIFVEGELTIKGDDGSLTMKGTDYDEEISATEKLTIDGANIIAFDKSDEFVICAPEMLLKNNCNLDYKCIYGDNIQISNVNADNVHEIYKNYGGKPADEILINDSNISVEYIFGESIFVYNSKVKNDLYFEGKSLECQKSNLTVAWLHSDYMSFVSSSVLTHGAQTNCDNPEDTTLSIKDSTFISNIKSEDDLQGTVYDIGKVIFISGKLDVTGIDDAFDPQPVFEIADGYKKVVDTKTHVVIDKDNGAGSGGTVPGTTTVAEKPITLDNKGTPVNAVITTQASDANGTPLPAGDLSSHVKVENNKVVFDKAKDMPALEGYTFKGWVSSGKKVSKIPANKLASMTVTATYVENVYNITYKLDKPKGTKVSAKAAPLKKVKYTEEKELAKDLTAANAKTGENYKLVGWATSKGGAKVYEPGQKISKIGGQTKKDKKVTLYPVWKLG